MICNTFELQQSEFRGHVNRLLERCVMKRDESDNLKLTPIFEKCISSQKDYGIDQFVKDELGPSDIQSQGVYLSGVILLGMCLIPHGIIGNDLFHCLNIILKSLQLEPIDNSNSKVVLGWINDFYPDMTSGEIPK